MPLLLLPGLPASHRVRAHVAALVALAALIAVFVLGMPVRLVGASAAYGLFPIGWIVLNVIVLYRMTVERGHFARHAHAPRTRRHRGLPS